jgi:hypothetical protein
MPSETFLTKNRYRSFLDLCSTFPTHCVNFIGGKKLFPTKITQCQNFQSIFLFNKSFSTIENLCQIKGQLVRNKKLS